MYSSFPHQHPPGSQAPSPSVPPSSAIFSSLNVYCDAGSVRPATIRAFRGAGGHIVTDPKASDLIVVDSRINTGLLFVQDWGSEKPVLEAAWVHKSIEAGRILREGDWGGYRARADPSMTRVDLDESASLPTPRITPVENAAASSWSPQLSSNNAGSPQPPLLYSQNPPPGLGVSPQLGGDLYSQLMLDVMRNQNIGGSWPSGSIAHLPPEPSEFFGPPEASPSPPPDSASTRRSLSIDVKGKGRASTGSNSLFTSASGAPLTFYVSLEVQKRVGLIAEIKRHGGITCSSAGEADFAILATRSRDYTTLLESVASSDNGIAVKPTFVYDCVAQGDLLVTDGYEYELPIEKKAKPVQRKVSTSRKPSSTMVKKQPAPEPAPVYSPPPLAQTEPVVVATTSVKPAARPKSILKTTATPPVDPAPSPSEAPDRPRSPTPPPESTRVLHSTGKYRYPQIEDEYAVKLAAFLYARECTTPLSLLARKLHEKLPHHSETAWTNRVQVTLRNQIEEVRKRALIAHRKEQRKQDVVNSKAEPVAKRPRLSEPIAPTAADIFAQEIGIVAEFFANGGDSEEAEGEETQEQRDARVWRQLTSRQACRTAPTWEIFYNNNHEKVMEAYDALIKAQEEAGQ